MREPELRRRADPSLLLLISLASGPKHGHAMMLDVEAFSGQRLGPGTLYGALQRLDEDGYVEPLTTVSRRVPYRLTETGRLYLAARLAEMQKLVQLGTERVHS